MDFHCKVEWSGILRVSVVYKEKASVLIEKS